MGGDQRSRLTIHRELVLARAGVGASWCWGCMIRRRGQCARGLRLLAPVPHGHWKTTTLIAGLRTTGITAPYALDGAVNGAIFRAYVEQMLAPSLAPGDILILDNLLKDVPTYIGFPATLADSARIDSTVRMEPYRHVDRSQGSQSPWGMALLASVSASPIMSNPSTVCRAACSIRRAQARATDRSGGVNCA